MGKINYFRNLVETMKKIIEFILCIILSPICSAILIFAAILLIPFGIYRAFVSLLGKFHPDLHKLVASRFSMFAADDIYGNQGCTLNNCQMVKGRIDLEWLRKTFLENVVEKKNEDGELKYRQLKQYPYQWMGFMFWKWEKNFDMNQHIKYYEDSRFRKDSTVTQEQLRQIEMELVYKSYEKKTSPWEILIVHNVESEDGDGEECSMMYLRFHHCLVDGFSVVKMERNFAWMKEDEIEKLLNPANMKRTSFWLKCLLIPYAIFVYPYQMLKICAQMIDFHPWRLLRSKQFKQKEYTSLSSKLPMQLFKEVAKFHKVGVTAVIYAVFTASIRKAMMKKNIKVPKNIHTGMAIPMPGHPDKLAIHVEGTFLELPIGQKDSVKRLKMINLNLRTMGLVPLVTFYLHKLEGCLMPSIARLIFAYPVPCTVTSTVFAGPKTPMKLNGHEITDIHGLVLPKLCKFGFFLATLSYREKIRMAITVNSAILDNQMDVNDLQEGIIEELQLLHDYADISEKEEAIDIV